MAERQKAALKGQASLCWPELWRLVRLPAGFADSSARRNNWKRVHRLYSGFAWSRPAKDRLQKQSSDKESKFFFSWVGSNLHQDLLIIWQSCLDWPYPLRAVVSGECIVESIGSIQIHGCFDYAMRRCWATLAD